MLGSLFLFLIFGLVSSLDTKEKFNSNYTLPPTFGNFTHGDLVNALSCGAVMTTYNSVNAYSNGANQGTGNSCAGYGTYGYQYQCVEYVQRYFAQKYGTPAIWYGNAIDLCNSHPSSVSLTTKPVAGDAVVLNFQPYGHTAIITSVGSSTISVAEQNAATYGTNSYSTSSVLCYLHYGSSSSGSCPSSGHYCGNDGLGLSANNLYYCSGAGAVPSLTTACAFTCETMPSGTADKCSSGSCSGLSNGYYCGNDLIGGDASALYLCSGGKGAGAKYCSTGCVVAPAGTADHCK